MTKVTRLRDINNDLYKYDGYMFYYDQPDAEYFSNGTEILHRTEKGVKHIYSFSESDKNIECDFSIVELLNFENHIVMLINYPITRNILCLRKDTDEVVWRGPVPKPVFKDRRNYWVQIRQEDKSAKKVYCHSIDRYRAAFDLETGILVWERVPKGPDVRDF